MATKKEMYELIKSELSDKEDVVAFCDHEIELLSRKRSKSSKPTAKQVENAGIKDRILEVLGESETPMTIPEVISTLGEDYTSQRISALMTQLIKAEKVIKTYEKKVAYFGLA